MKIFPQVISKMIPFLGKYSDIHWKHGCVLSMVLTLLPVGCDGDPLHQQISEQVQGFQIALKLTFSNFICQGQGQGETKERILDKHRAKA